MQVPNSSVGSEIEDYVSEVNQWMTELNTKEIPEDQSGVVSRFKRDCDLFVKDVEVKESPSAHDLVDFTDRFNMLSIHFKIVIRDLS